jgi:hypothetical protein
VTEVVVTVTHLNCLDLMSRAVHSLNVTDGFVVEGSCNHSLYERCQVVCALLGVQLHHKLHDNFDAVGVINSRLCRDRDGGRGRDRGGSQRVELVSMLHDSRYRRMASS